MAYRLSMNIGFVTNSSAMVYHFPRTLLDDPKVKGFLDAFELHGGFVGTDLWSRDLCTTVAMTKEQKQEAVRQLHAEGYENCHGPSIDTEDDSVVVIYGDEHQSIANSLSHILCEVAEKMGIRVGGQEYN